MDFQPVPEIYAIHTEAGILLQEANGLASLMREALQAGDLTRARALRVRSTELRAEANLLIERACYLRH
jgi:phosphoenolpyruvate synthase/pyruvate phosphate dikinase